jgi:hypothetical protein
MPWTVDDVERFHKGLTDQELEIDVVVRIPPIRERSVRVKVKTVEKKER